MITIEQAAELHESIEKNAPAPLDGLHQTIHMSKGWAVNQAARSITFKSLIAKDSVPDDMQSTFLQGFGCVEINITASWGGCKTETEITVHILDRLAGGMAKKTWETNGVFGATKITENEVIPLLRSLLGQESLESIQRRENEEKERVKEEWIF